MGKWEQKEQENAKTPRICEKTRFFADFLKKCERSDFHDLWFNKIGGGEKMITVMTENGEEARVYYGVYGISGGYAVEAVISEPSGAYGVSTAPFQKKEDAEELARFLEKNAVLPVHLKSVCEDLSFIDK